MSDALRAALGATLRESPIDLTGRVVAAGAASLRAIVPGAAIGDVCLVERAAGPLRAEVVGFDEDAVILLPGERLDGVRPGATVTTAPRLNTAPDALAAAGLVLDPLGRRLDTGAPVPLSDAPLRAAPPNPLRRARIAAPVHTGLRVLDGMLPLGVGQRVGLFAGSGVGKSTLLAQLVRGCDAEAVVVALVGERGREVREFLDDALRPDVRARTTVVVATADAAPALRIRAVLLATALAEQHRARGAHCALFVDSVTRYARALREAALLAGEPPARRGFPASVFAELPAVFERAGTAEQGAITGIYTVLVEGGDLEEPVADEVRGIVDGHVVLDRRLAERGHFPAVDVLSSVSRVAGAVADPHALADATAVRRALARLHEHRDAIDLGIYRRGTDAALDQAIAARADIDAFLQQPPDDACPAAHTRDQLADLAFRLGP